MKKFFVVLSWLLTVAVAAGAGFLVGKYTGFIENVKTDDVYKYMTIEEPKDIFDERALNVLLIGSDTRNGDRNAAIGGIDTVEEGMRSDTNIILHIPADRKNVSLVSIPRDSIVTIPTCLREDGTSSKEIIDAQFNWAFSQGDNLASSVACTMATIQENTGVQVDAFAVIDFAGFENIIDSLGGVEIDIPSEMKSEKAGIHLQPGLQTLNGKDALGFARARTFEIYDSSGSDLERIKRQQILMDAISKKLLDPENLKSPTRIYAVIEGLMSNLTVSPQFADVKNTSSLAFSLKDLESVDFYTVPTTEWEYDKNRVIWTEDAVGYWDALINDTPMPGKDTEATIEDTTAPPAAE